MKYKKYMVAGLFAGFFIYQSSYAALLVYDPVNYIENETSAAQSLLIQTNTYQSLEQMYTDYQLLKKNLSQLENLPALIGNDLNISKNLNSYYGTAPLSQLATLNPDSPDYAEQRDAILTQYFQKPVDPNLIQAEFQEALTQDQIDSMKNDAQAQNMSYQILQDSVDESTHAQNASVDRKQAITDYKDTLNGLDDSSQVKIEQTTSLEMNLALQQNEQLVQLNNEVLKYSRMQKAYEDSETAKESQAEQASLERAINQGASGLGRDSWGDF